MACKENKRKKNYITFYIFCSLLENGGKTAFFAGAFMNNAISFFSTPKKHKNLYSIKAGWLIIAELGGAPKLLRTRHQ
jgi:hypothetical protein